jgi:hypothetical protein
MPLTPEEAQDVSLIVESHLGVVPDKDTEHADHGLTLVVRQIA